MSLILRPLLTGSLHQQTTSLVLKKAANCPSFLRPFCLGPATSHSLLLRNPTTKHKCHSSIASKKLRLFSTEVDHSLDTGELVYKGRIGHMFKLLKVFSLTTSSVGLAVQPYLLVTSGDMSLAAALPLFGAINMFVFLNPILIHYVAKKYVSELYYNPQSGVFTAVLLTFFARKMNFTFKAADVQVPDVPGPFSMLTAKGKPLFVHEGDFNDMEVYKHLMGFDQPLRIVYKQDELDE